MKFTTLSALALTILLPLSACGQNPTDSQPGADNTAQASSDAGDKPSSSALSGLIEAAMQEAKQELLTSNIDVDSVHVGGSSSSDNPSLPKAEITPQGDLLIAGKKVDATPAQHALLLDYRQQIVGIALSGMDLGTQGADIGIHAAKTALSGVFSGKSDAEIEAAIKPQTDKIKATALKLCKRLPALLSSQQQLAAAMPAFKPYATMQQKDVDDCSENIANSGNKKGTTVLSF